MQITGTLTGGGSTGGGFDGGTITQPIVIKHVFPQFANLVDLRYWMYADSANTPSNSANNPLGLRFSEAPSGNWTDLYGVIVGSSASGAPVAPSVATNHNLLVRKDFYARGKLCSYEGIILLRGNGLDAIGPGNPGGPNNTWNIGWGTTHRNTIYL